MFQDNVVSLSTTFYILIMCVRFQNKTVTTITTAEEKTPLLAQSEH